jgi:hypothetical protein
LTGDQYNFGTFLGKKQAHSLPHALADTTD